MRFVRVMQRVFDFTTNNGFFVHDSPGRIINLSSDVQIAERHEDVVTHGVNSIKWSFPDAEGLSWAVFCLPVDDLADALVLRAGVNNKVSFIRMKLTGVNGYTDVVTEDEWTAFADTVLKPALENVVSDENELE